MTNFQLVKGWKYAFVYTFFSILWCIYFKKIVNPSSAKDFAFSAGELEIGSESWRLGIYEEDKPVKNSKENVPLSLEASAISSTLFILSICFEMYMFASRTSKIFTTFRIYSFR